MVHLFRVTEIWHNWSIRLVFVHDALVRMQSFFLSFSIFKFFVCVRMLRIQQTGLVVINGYSYDHVMRGL